MVDASVYRCFKADKRISMDVYSDNLVNALELQGMNLSIVRPSSMFERWDNNSLVMRYLRYRHYPSLVKKKSYLKSSVHHIADHGYAHLLPFLGTGKKYISVHDLIPLLTWKEVIRKPDGQKFGFRKPRLNLYSLNFLKKFDRVIAISQSTADDLQKYLNIAPKKITVIPPIIGDAFCPQDELKVVAFRDKHGLDKKNKWVMISGQEFYKNHRTSLQVLDDLLKNTDQKVKIIKTGRFCSSFNRLVEEMQLQNYVKQLYLENVKELPLLYNSVDCLLFPSLYEGFGMPVAEALACGTPVVTSNMASLPEVGGELTIQCEPSEVNALSAAVMTQLNKGVKEQLLLTGPKWVKQFRVSEVGRKINDLYQMDI